MSAGRVIATVLLVAGVGLEIFAVIGPNAESLAALEGNYNGTPEQPVLPVDGLRRQFKRAQVLYAQGSAYVSELPIHVPRTVFHPATGDARSGLKGEYYGEAGFSGTPLLTRIDPQIQFDWNAASPSPGSSSNSTAEGSG